MADRSERYQNGCKDISVSICIASYNMVDTIRESLNSIIEDLPNNFEIVIVDQSTDGSKEAIDEVAVTSDLEFKRIYTEFPLGVGHARNLAVSKATGDIVITHVDVDDWYDSQYFSALVEFYLLLREKRGSDFFFSCPNMNITDREFMIENYLLTSLPIGANEKEYRWRACRNDDFLQLELETPVSGRIQLSERKTLFSRLRRTYVRHLGMYKIGYSTRRILREDVIERSWPMYSRAFRTAIIPFVWVHSLFAEEVCQSPLPNTTLAEEVEKRTYELTKLKEIYDIQSELSIDRLVDSPESSNPE